MHLQLRQLPGHCLGHDIGIRIHLGSFRLGEGGEIGHRHGHPRSGDLTQRRQRMMGDAEVAAPRIGVRHPQQTDRTTAEQGRGVEMLSRDQPRIAVLRTSAQVSGSLSDDGDIGIHHMLGSEQSRVDGHRFQISAPGLPGADHARQPVGISEPGDGLGERGRQSRTIAEHISHRQRRVDGPYSGDHCGQCRMQIGHDHGHALEVLRLGEGGMML